MQKIKSILYSILLIMSVALSTISGVYASLNTTADSSINLEYSPAYLKDPATFKNNITTLSGDTAITEIVFDYYTEEYLEIIENATGSVSVEQNSSDEIMAYAVPNDSGNTIYVLSSSYMYTGNSCSNMFSDLSSLKTIEFNNFDTRDSTTMSHMFKNCSSLTSIDVSCFRTSNVADMASAFSGCKALTRIDGLEYWDTSNVTNAGSMFYMCKSVTALAVENWNVKNVTRFGSIFQYCSNVASLDVSKWTNSVATSLYAMFAQCSTLTSINISGFTTSKVSQMAHMFVSCSKLTTIYVGSGWTTASVTSSGGMFQYATNLVGGNGTKFDSNYVDATYARVDTAETPGYLTLAS